MFMIKCSFSVHVCLFVRSLDCIFTARCYAERGYATVSRPSVCLSVRLSVCDVQVCFSHRLEYFENTLTADSLRYLLTLALTWVIWSVGNTPKIRVEWGWGHECKTCNISETLQDMTKVTMTD